MTENLKEFRAFIKENCTSYTLANYEEISSWSSMQSLIIVSAIDEKYDVLISYEELASLKNMEELFSFIHKKTVQ